MSCGIYCIENKINHKKYVGQSIDIKSRWTQHRHTSSLVRDTFLYRAMDKYGVENFDFYILEECQPDELDIKEIYWIATLDTYNYGYNMTLGGSGLVGYKAYNRNCIPKNFGMLSNGVLLQVIFITFRLKKIWTTDQLLQKAIISNRRLIKLKNLLVLLV